MFFCEILTEDGIPNDADNRQKHDCHYPRQRLDWIAIFGNHKNNHYPYGKEINNLYDQ
jgi:hypothetical protein